MKKFAIIIIGAFGLLALLRARRRAHLEAERRFWGDA